MRFDHFPNLAEGTIWVLGEVRQQMLDLPRLLSQSGFFAPISIGDLMCLHIKRVFGERLRLVWCGSAGMVATRTVLATMVVQPRTTWCAWVAHPLHVFIKAVVAF